MKIQWLGHSAFKLTESTGASIITDPFEPSAIGYSMAYLNCDAVTSSRANPANNNFKGVKGDPIILNTMGTHDINGIGVSSILSSSVTSANKPMKNLIFKFRLDGVSVCHFGAIKELCSAEFVEELIPINILLIPVGGEDSLDAEEAKAYVDNIMPDIVIPMAFKTKSCELDIDKVDSFLRLFDDSSIIVSHSEVMEFDRYDFDDSNTKIIVPKRFKG